MKATAKGNLFWVIATTVTWLISISLVILFFTRVAGWPLDLALLITVPILMVWLPASYFLVIAGNKRHQRGDGVVLAGEELGSFGLLGLLTGALSASAALLYVFVRAAFYGGIIIVSLFACLAIYAVVRVLRRWVRGDDQTTGRRR